MGRQLRQGGLGRTLALATLALTSLAVSGCDKKPTGQVVATVDGMEITRRDLVAELEAVGGRSGEDLKAIQPALVESIVNRKLLVEEAKRQNLDQNPQYLLLQQRLQEVLLSQMLAQSWSGKATAPSNAAAQAFIAENPHMFGGRKLMLADEIRTGTNSISQAQLANLRSNAEIAAFLTSKKIQFERGQKTIDTLQLPADLASNLVGRVGGEPLAIRSGTQFSIAAIQAVRDAPVPPAEQLKVAKTALQQKSALAEADRQVKQLRGAADVKYTPEFAPPASKGSAGKAAT